MNRGDELDRDISLALAKRVESGAPSFATARRLQREGKKLRKRYLSPVSNAGEIAKRDAVDQANDAGWNNPPPSADEAGKRAVGAALARTLRRRVQPRRNVEAERFVASVANLPAVPRAARRSAPRRDLSEIWRF